MIMPPLEMPRLPETFCRVQSTLEHLPAGATVYFPCVAVMFNSLAHAIAYEGWKIHCGGMIVSPLYLSTICDQKQEVLQALKKGFK